MFLFNAFNEVLLFKNSLCLSEMISVSAFSRIQAYSTMENMYTIPGLAWSNVFLIEAIEDRLILNLCI